MRQIHEPAMTRLTEVDLAVAGACFGGSSPCGWRSSGPSGLGTA